jgi:hypothetical protein
MFFAVRFALIRVPLKFHVYIIHILNKISTNLLLYGVPLSDRPCSGDGQVHRWAPEKTCFRSSMWQIRRKVEDYRGLAVLATNNNSFLTALSLRDLGKLLLRRVGPNLSQHSQYHFLKDCNKIVLTSALFFALIQSSQQRPGSGFSEKIDPERETRFQYLS